MKTITTLLTVFFSVILLMSGNAQTGGKFSFTDKNKLKGANQELTNAKLGSTLPYTTIINKYNPDESGMYFWNGSSWDTLNKVTYSYSNGKGIEQVEYFYQGNNIYEPMLKAVNTYNSNGDLSLTEQFTYDGTQWQQDFRTTYLYSAQGMDGGYIEEMWNGSSWDTTAGEQNVFTYNGPLLMDITYNEYIDGYGWLPVSKEEYIYTSSNLLLEVVSSIHNGTGWEFESKAVNIVWHDYLAFLVDSFTIQTWDGTNWWDEQKVLLTYNNDDQVLEERFQYFMGTWMDVLRYVATYDGQGNMTYESMDLFDGSVWLEMDAQKHHYVYNNANQVISETMEVLDTDTGLWTNVAKMDYKYSGGLGVKEPVKTIHISAYPNPVKDIVTVVTGKNEEVLVTMFDLNGRIVAQEISMEGTAKIDMSAFTNGIYIIAAETGADSQVLKVVKQ